MNKFEKIKRMTIDEMTNFLFSHSSCAFCIYDELPDCNPAIGCEGGIKQWLQSDEWVEVEGAEDE